TGKGSRITLLESREADRFERGAQAGLHLGAVHADLLHRERDFQLDTGAEQLCLKILKYHSHLRRRFTHPQAVESSLSDHDDPAEFTTFKFGDQAIEAFGERGLAGSRCPHDSDHFASPLFEAE